MNPGTGATKSQFTVRGIDPNDADAAEQLQPLQDILTERQQAKNAAQKEVNRLSAMTSPDPVELAEANRLLVEADALINNIQSEIAQKKDELATDYATPLRIVDFTDPVTKEAAQRPIRRAAGGMVRSGIGAMAREVL